MLSKGAKTGNAAFVTDIITVKTRSTSRGIVGEAETSGQARANKSTGEAMTVRPDEKASEPPKDKDPTPKGAPMKREASSPNEKPQQERPDQGAAQGADANVSEDEKKETERDEEKATGEIDGGNALALIDEALVFKYMHGSQEAVTFSLWDFGRALYGYAPTPY
jgi:hypothetical protein